MSLSPALEIAAQLCEILSILHSSFSILPKASPLSINARLYHLPSHALVLSALFSFSDISSYLLALSSSPLSLQIGSIFFKITYRKKPSHTLSPFPLFPTLLNPSFQSPEPILGSPFSPKFKECSIALIQ